MSRGLQHIRVDGVSRCADRLRAHLHAGGFVLHGDGESFFDVRIAIRTDALLALDSVDSPLEARILANLQELHPAPVVLKRAGGNQEATAAVIDVPETDAEQVALAVYRAILQVSAQTAVAEQAQIAEARAAEAHIAEQARLDREHAAEQARIERAWVAEQARIEKQAEAAEQARAAQQARAAEQAFLAEQARIDRAHAAEQTRIAQAWAAEQARLAAARARQWWRSPAWIALGIGLLLSLILGGLVLSAQEPVQIREGANIVQVTTTAGGSLQVESANLLANAAIAVRCANAAGTSFVECGIGGSGTSDTDDGSIAGGQSVGLNAALANVWSGAAWVRLTQGQALMAASIPVTFASDQSALAVTGTFWQATQPVSGTVTANAGSGTFVVGDGAGALNVIVDSITAGDTDIGNVDLEIAGTGVSTGVGASGAQTLRTASLIHDGTDTALVSAGGALLVDASATTQPVSGTVSVTLPNEGQQTAANSISVTPDTDNDAIGAPAAAVPGEAIQIAGTDGTNLIVPYIDPCQREARTNFVVDIVTATTTEIANAVASEFFWICSIHLFTAGINNVAIVEDDTDACTSPTAGLNGGTTAAEGYNWIANQGIVIGTGQAWVMKTATANRYLCIITSAAVQLSGTISFVSAP